MYKVYKDFCILCTNTDMLLIPLFCICFVQNSDVWTTKIGVRYPLFALFMYIYHKRLKGVRKFRSNSWS